MVGVTGRIHGNDESGLHPNYPPADFPKATVSGSREAEAISWQPWSSWLSAGDQSREQVGTSVQMLLAHPHSPSL